MMATNSTPCAALFNMMKKYGGISYKELASLILSGKPLSDGQSPASRVNDRSWLSRFIVHAPAGSLQDRYFADFAVSALRVIARLKSKSSRSLTSEQILDMVCGKHGEEMEAALKACHQETSVYRNMLKRLQSEAGFTVDERAEIAMVLLLTAGCTADVRRATSIAVDFAHSIHGQGVATPLVTPTSKQLNATRIKTSLADATTLGLLRIMDNYIVGAPHWIPAGVRDVNIGSIVTDGCSITDVEPDVSSKHAHIYLDEDGQWYIEGLGSLNGTTLESGSGQGRVVVEPARADRGAGYVSAPVSVKPGDKITFGSCTTFVVLEGISKA